MSIKHICTRSWFIVAPMWVMWHLYIYKYICIYICSRSAKEKAFWRRALRSSSRRWWCRAYVAGSRVDTKDLQPVSSAPSTAPSPPVPGCQGGQNGLSRPGGAQAGLGGSRAQQTAIQKGPPHHQLSSRACCREANFSKSLAWVFFWCLFMIRIGLKNFTTLSLILHDWK